jgi:myo-inositol 2-dehydrogenase/D-chiro-inositol 1-dehydrogenase
LRQGKPVLCEKPLATNADDACQILDAELQLGRRLVQVGFMRRYDPQHVAVKRAVESGAIGRPVLFKGWHRNVGGESSVQSESVVIGSAIHDLDSARWLTGQEIEDVFVRGVCTEPISSPGAWDLQVIQMTMSGGCLATIEVYVNARYGYDVGVEIVGDQGTAQTTPSARAVVRRNLAQAQAVERDWLERFDTAYISELQNWSDTLRRGDPPSGPSAWDGYTSLLAAEACIKSIRSGQVERLPLQESPVLYKR